MDVGTVDKMSIVAHCERMKNFSAKDAKNHFGQMVDAARLEPVVIEKHGRPMVVVCSVEEFERLSQAAASRAGADRERDR
jgi:prevent-host-death family protein